MSLIRMSVHRRRVISRTRTCAPTLRVGAQSGSSEARASLRMSRRMPLAVVVGRRSSPHAVAHRHPAFPLRSRRRRANEFRFLCWTRASRRQSSRRSVSIHKSGSSSFSTHCPTAIRRRRRWVELSPRNGLAFRHPAHRRTDAGVARPRVEQRDRRLPRGRHEELARMAAHPWI